MKNIHPQLKIYILNRKRRKIMFHALYVYTNIYTCMRIHTFVQINIYMYIYMSTKGITVACVHSRALRGRHQRIYASHGIVALYE
jgi:hypothetical protein